MPATLRTNLQFSIRVLLALLAVSAVAALAVRTYLETPPYFLSGSSTTFAPVHQGAADDYSEPASAIRIELLAWSRQKGEFAVPVNLLFIGPPEVRIEQKLREISSSVENWQRKIEFEVSQLTIDGESTPFATASLLVDLQKQSVSLGNRSLDLHDDRIYLIRMLEEKHLDFSVTEAQLNIPGVPEELLQELRIEVAKLGW